MRERTEIVVNEDGSETHESWVRLTTSKPSSTPGARLFDSDIPHQHYVTVRVERTERRRDLNRDWFYNTETLMQLDMSEAQWGGFVSSFGDGGGVPATLRFLTGVGYVPEAVPQESRLQASAREVKESGVRAVAGVRERFDEVEAAFLRGAGKREMRAAIQSLKWKIEGVPENMKFAADSLTEHVENVVAKARGDIEGMARTAALNAGETKDLGVSLLGSGEEAP